MKYQVRGFLKHCPLCGVPRPTVVEGKTESELRFVCVSCEADLPLNRLLAIIDEKRGSKEILFYDATERYEKYAQTQIANDQPIESFADWLIEYKYTIVGRIGASLPVTRADKKEMFELHKVMSATAR